MVFLLNFTENLEDGLTAKIRHQRWMDRASKAFGYADVEGKKFLTKHQYKVAMTAVFGYCPDKWDIKQAFDSSYMPEDLMTFQKFQDCVKRKIESTDNMFELECFFACLDKNFKGYVGLEDLLTAAKRVNLRISSSILKSTFKELDRDRKGFVGMDEFVAMILGTD